MKNFLALLAMLFISVWPSLLAQRITDIYTDFNYRNQGCWYANGSFNENSKEPEKADQPSNTHHLLAFTWKGTTYTTGVNDALLQNKFPAKNFVNKSFRAFPVAYLPPAINGTYVGVGYHYGGAGNVTLSNNSMEYYLTDGIRGFDLATGVYNLPQTGSKTSYQPSKYTVTKVETANYNEPVVVISQMGQPGSNSAEDVFYFVDGNGNVIGKELSVKFSDIDGVGWGYFKFYSIGSGGLTYVTNPSGSRVLRFIAYSLNDFGIDTEAKAKSIKQFWQELSGTSDQAFIGAYDTKTMEIAQSVSGFVYKGGAATLGSPGYAGAIVKLFAENGITEIAQSTTNAAGYFLFGDIPKGNYIIRLVVPAGYNIVGASDNNQDVNIAITVGEEPVTHTFFSLMQTLAVDFGTITAKIADDGALWVNWSTLSEKDNSHFEIGVSRDGKTFTDIGTIASKAPGGFATGELEYEFVYTAATAGSLWLLTGVLLLLPAFNIRRRKICSVLLLVFVCSGIFLACNKKDDRLSLAKGSLYVRIKQVDHTGTFQYSKVLKVIK